jgi:hypothetical protein
MANSKQSWLLDVFWEHLYYEMVEFCMANSNNWTLLRTKIQETERAYENDWALLELFFTNCGDNCATWTCLFRKGSIYDRAKLPSGNLT